jgi:hypothetical protein
MKKLISVVLVFILFSCNIQDYKYKIRGTITVTKSGKKQIYDAIWYTDTISFDGDTAYYFNSDKSEVRIYPPFTINTSK